MPKKKVIKIKNVFSIIGYKSSKAYKQIVEINGKKYLKLFSFKKKRPILIYLRGKNPYYISELANKFIRENINYLKENYLSFEEAIKKLGLSKAGARHFLKDEHGNKFFIRKIGDKEYRIEVIKYMNKLFFNKKDLNEFLKEVEGIRLNEVEKTLGLKPKTLTKLFSPNGEFEFSLNNKRYKIKLKKVHGADARLSVKDIYTLELFFNAKRKIKEEGWLSLKSNLSTNNKTRKRQLNTIINEIKIDEIKNTLYIPLLDSYHLHPKIRFIELNNNYFLERNHLILLKFWLSLKENNMNEIYRFLKHIKEKKELTKVQALQLWMVRNYYNGSDNKELDRIINNQQFNFLFNKYPLEIIAKSFS